MSNGYNYKGMQTITLTETFGEGDSIKPKWHMNQNEFNEACDTIFGHKPNKDTSNEQSKSST